MSPFLYRNVVCQKYQDTEGFIPLDSHTRRDFGCPYMQLAFKLVNQAMDLDKKGITVLAPTIGFSLGEEFMRNSFMNLGKQLKHIPDETERALNLGMKTFHEFETRVE